MDSHGSEAPEFHERHSHCHELLTSLRGDGALVNHDLILGSEGDIRAIVLTFASGRRVRFEPWTGPMSLDELAL